MFLRETDAVDHALQILSVISETWLKVVKGSLIYVAITICKEENIEFFPLLCIIKLRFDVLNATHYVCSAKNLSFEDVINVFRLSVCCYSVLYGVIEEDHLYRFEIGLILTWEDSVSQIYASWL